MIKNNYKPSEAKSYVEQVGKDDADQELALRVYTCLLYTSPSPRDPKTSRMPSSA